jgi:hypothetical protein
MDRKILISLISAIGIVLAIVLFSASVVFYPVLGLIMLVAMMIGMFFVMIYSGIM